MEKNKKYIIILDDEVLSMSYLGELVKEVLETNNNYKDFEILQTNQHGVFFELIKTYKPEIIFLDIQMPGKNGIEIANYINENYKELNYEDLPIIIFTTAYENYGYQAFKVDAFDYLLKPIEEKSLKLVFDKIYDKKKSLFFKTNDNIKVNSNGIDLEIPLKDILFFKADMKYIVVVTKLKEFLLNETLINLEKENPKFIKIHRSYLVNPNYISRFYKKDNSWFVVLKNYAIHLPISRRQKPEIKEKIDYKIIFNGDEF